jgi:hypothetical protein
MVSLQLMTLTMMLSLTKPLPWFLRRSSSIYTVLV